MSPATGKVGRGKLAIVLVLLALSLAALFEIGRVIVRRPANLVRSVEQSPGRAAGPLTALRADEAADADRGAGGERP